MPRSSDPAKRGDRPARGPGNGKARPQFEPGNAMARTHGAKGQLNPEALAAKTQTIVEALSAAAPVRSLDGSLPAADSFTVRLLADALCRLDLISDWLAERGLFDADDAVRPSVDLERRLRTQALEIAAELGMTPRSRAALGLDLVRGMSAAEQLSHHISRTYDADSITAP